MPGRNRPSFLKRQKEQQRKARATEKREARRARKDARADESAGHVPDLAAEGETEFDVEGDTEPEEGAEGTN